MTPMCCPWCGNLEQYTDPRGMCARCKIPWRTKDFMIGVDDVALSELIKRLRAVANAAKDMLTDAQDWGNQIAIAEPKITALESALALADAVRAREQEHRNE